MSSSRLRNFIAIEKFQAKRWPQIITTAQDLKQKRAERHAPINRTRRMTHQM
jgi:hypothetical protein